MTYGGDTSNDETYFYLILYGPNSDIVPKAYYLQDPSGDINGNPYTEIFAGMKERPLDSNIDGWLNVTREYTCRLTNPSVTIRYPWPPPFPAPWER